MKLAWLTDIHLEMVEPATLERFLRAVDLSGVDAVLVGGDIGTAPGIVRWLDLMESRWQRPVYFVLGNHDFYHGSIASVLRSMDAFRTVDRYARWLPAMGVVPLTERTALIGHGGWGDGRHGDHDGTPVVLNDFMLIDELSGLSIDQRRRILAELGDEAADSLRPALRDALDGFEHVIVVTHVPPFTDACWHDGRLSNGNWRPFFVCKATGDALSEAHLAHPDKRVTVLCGHTHSPGIAEPQQGLTVLTGGATYGQPVIEKIFDADSPATTTQDRSGFMKSPECGRDRGY